MNISLMLYNYIRLNNKGWGLTEMIVICCGILLCLLVVIYYINIVQHGIDTDKTGINYNEGNNNSEIIDNDNKEDNDYNDYFIQCQNAAINYVLKMNVIEDVKTISVPLVTLINEGYVTELEECTGNVIVDKEDDVYTASAQIVCNKEE